MLHFAAAVRKGQTHSGKDSRDHVEMSVAVDPDPPAILLQRKKALQLGAAFDPDLPLQFFFPEHGKQQQTAGIGHIGQHTTIGGVIPEAGEFIEFSDNSYRRPPSERTSNYLHEAYIREIDGQDCIFLVRDDVLVKTPVQTGKRMDEYIELLNLTLTADDYLAFPYDKNAKDGAPVKYPPEGGGRYW